MTKHIEYSTLTWPEVAALPRHTPIMLPLGNDYDRTSTTADLDTVDAIIWLPAFPFGWQGSGIEVSRQTLGHCITNLLNCLFEDGFTNIHTLIPDHVRLDLPEAVTRHHYPENPSTPLLSPTGRDRVVIAPVGHTEQHGYHLPMSTDTLIIASIGKNTANAIPDQAVCLPVVPYGVSTHRKAFAGTFNLGGRAFEDFWVEVVDNLVSQGFDKIYLMSGHGGNCSFLTNVVKYAGERHKRIFCATAWLYLSGPSGVSALDEYRSSPIGGMGHACELETSLILHLRPDLVGMDKVVDEVDFIATPSYYMDWVEGGAIIANPPWDDDTATGSYGAGSYATAEKGAAWLKAAVDEKVSHIHEIHEQQARREARRQAGYGLWGQGQSSR